MTGDINGIEIRIGENLIRNGYMTKDSVDIVLLRQEYGDSRLFGQIATSLRFVSIDQLSKCLK